VKELDSEIVVIGILLSVLYYEATDISPGGVIVPAYLALYVENPVKIAITLIIAFSAYQVVNILSKHVIIFGRRKFSLMILFSYMIQVFSNELILSSDWMISVSSIGVIIPGIIASDFDKQGVTKTVFSLGIVVLIMYFIITLYKMSWGY
jgi:poly-gamma-glutamate biosynthesis protein PgsC/CapC